MSRYFTKTLAALEPYVPGEQLKIDDLVKLNANENPYPPAPGVAAAVAAAVLGPVQPRTERGHRCPLGRAAGEYFVRQRQRREPAAGPAGVLR